jgi:hypothetical protein
MTISANAAQKPYMAENPSAFVVDGSHKEKVKQGGVAASKV